MILKDLFNSAEKVPFMSWLCVFEHTRRFKGLLLSVPFIVSAVLSCEVGLAAVDFSRKVVGMVRRVCFSLHYISSSVE